MNPSPRRSGLIWNVANLCCLAGCAAHSVKVSSTSNEAEHSATTTHIPPQPVAARLPVPSIASTTLGHSIEGRPIECQVFGSGSDVILIMASIHGDEAAGTPLLRHLAEHLDARQELLHGRQILLIPVANPDGVHHHTRYNANRVDLNRNFPADNWKKRNRHGSAPLSEPEAQAIQEAIERFGPNRIVTIHQPAACVDYDGPAAALAKAMARAGKMRLKRIGLRPGSLGSYAGEKLRLPVVTLELPGSASRLDGAELWERYGPMLIAAIEYP